MSKEAGAYVEAAIEGTVATAKGTVATAKGKDATKDKGHADDHPTRPSAGMVAVSGAMFDMLVNAAVVLADAQKLLIDNAASERVQDDPEFALRYMKAATESMQASFSSVSDLLLAAKTKEGKIGKVDNDLFAALTGTVTGALGDPGASPTAPSSSRLGALLGGAKK